MFLAATVAFFLTKGHIHAELEPTEESQLIPSALAFGMGALLFWLCATFFMGRIYCSTVCPLGTLSDVAMRTRREIGKMFPRYGKIFRYKKEKTWRYHILALYIICLILGGVLLAAAYFIEPWNVMRNFAALYSPGSVAFTWAALGIGVGWGIASGIVVLLAVLTWGFFSGRDYCNTVCPIGTGLGVVSRYSLLHIEIDPDKCISCMKCQDGCRSSCIKVSERIVDNSRCVKCFDCTAVCPTGAIRLQSGRNKPATPMAVGND